MSDAKSVTAFLRPEDGVWDPNSKGDFYFVTTNAFTAPSRLWRMRFTDISNPEKVVLSPLCWMELKVRKCLITSLSTILVI